MREPEPQRQHRATQLWKTKHKYLNRQVYLCAVCMSKRTIIIIIVGTHLLYTIFNFVIVTSSVVAFLHPVPFFSFASHFINEIMWNEDVSITFIMLLALCLLFVFAVWLDICGVGGGCSIAMAFVFDVVNRELMWAHKSNLQFTLTSN